MAESDLPEPAPAFDLERFMGIWTVLASNREAWRERTHPLVEHGSLHDASPRRFKTKLRYRQIGLFGERSHLLDCHEQELRPGEFVRRSGRMLRVEESRWSVPLIDERRWAVIWSTRSNHGAAAGLDILTRAPWIEQRVLDEILAQIGAHSFLGGRAGGQRRCAGLFAITQDWVPPKPYRLRVG